MSLLQKLAGNSVEIKAEKLDPRLKEIIFEEEEVLYAFTSFRDCIILTTKRLIICDVQGITGSKIEYLTIPYSKVSCYSLEAAGTLDLEVDLKVWVSGYGVVERKIAKGVNVAAMSKILAAHIC